VSENLRNFRSALFASNCANHICSKRPSCQTAEQPAAKFEQTLNKPPTFFNPFLSLPPRPFFFFFFGGVGVIIARRFRICAAEILNLSPRTLDRQWAAARAWLYREIRNQKS
jgi:hypothetical protein